MEIIVGKRNGKELLEVGRFEFDGFLFVFGRRELKVHGFVFRPMVDFFFFVVEVDILQGNVFFRGVVEHFERSFDLFLSVFPFVRNLCGQ